MYDYNARFYDPQVGQFTQPDSLIPEPGNPIAWNRYAYVYNSPLNHTDSTGHSIDGLRAIANVAMSARNCFGNNDAMACYTGAVSAAAVAVPLVVKGLRVRSVQKAAIDSATRVPLASLRDGIKKAASPEINGAIEEMKKYVLQHGSLSRREVTKRFGLFVNSAIKGARSSDIVILGSFPEYVNMADPLYNFFDMPDELWKFLDNARHKSVWRINRAYIKIMVTQGKSFLITLGTDKPPGEDLMREITYLARRGYKVKGGLLVP